jgi:hypothetical protein
LVLLLGPCAASALKSAAALLLESPAGDHPMTKDEQAIRDLVATWSAGGGGGPGAAARRQPVRDVA